MDRLDRRRLVAAVDAFQSAALGLIGFAVLYDLVSLPLLYGAFFLVEMTETLFDTVSASVLPADSRPRATTLFDTFSSDVAVHR